MKRRVTVLIAVVCLVLNISTVSYASEVGKGSEANTNATGETGETGEIEPFYLNTSNISAGLRIEGNTAYCLAEVFAKKVCSIQIIMQLQRKENGSWVNKVSWVTSGTAGSKSSSQSYTLFEKGSYRVNVIANVGGEQVTCTSVTKTY